MIDELSNRAVRYVIEHGEEFVKVIVHATQEVIQMIENTLREATDKHLTEIALAAIAAGMVITAAIVGPAAVAVLPVETVAEAVGLPFLLLFHHEDLLNFIAGKAYVVSIIGE
ncbi:MAG: hypothetical protein HC769_13045 [Cyanobacteria bacterium CRU_2_1]|nr:hypothetical protein [Cyanobacteria bacterium RU_5_0]NJR59680.1 hypothetical protein [Cyanobacteria bacterium CRU_2_1]